MVEDKCANVGRRKFRRVEDVIFIFCSLLTPPNKFRAITSNVGAGGLMFETERNILSGSKVVVEIYQPMNNNKTTIFSIPVLARVVWRKKIEKDKFEQGENKYKVGIEFLEIEEEDRQRIAKYIEMH